ncbi:MAG: hypothetical protein HYU28_05730, partial [Actinobacteria bacterium]|nr:hypothetical protein [Actinomycetota bacterium]
ETRGGAGAADDEAEALGIWPATVVSVGEGEETTGAPVTFVALRMATRAATALARAADEDRVRLVLVGDLDDVPGDLLFADRFAPQGEGEAPGAAPADDAGEEVGS